MYIKPPFKLYYPWHFRKRVANTTVCVIYAGYSPSLLFIRLCVGVFISTYMHVLRERPWINIQTLAATRMQKVLGWKN